MEEDMGSDWGKEEAFLLDDFHPVVFQMCWASAPIILNQHGQGSGMDIVKCPKDLNVHLYDLLKCKGA